MCNTILGIVWFQFKIVKRQGVIQLGIGFIFGVFIDGYFSGAAFVSGFHKQRVAELLHGTIHIHKVGIGGL